MTSKFLKLAFLSDSKRDWIKKTYGLTDEQVNLCLKADPEEGTYVPWIANNLKNKTIRLPEDESKIKEQLVEFDKLKNSPNFNGSKDIGTYSPSDVYKLIQSSKPENLSEKEQIRRLIERGASGAELIVNKGDYKIFKVSDPELLTILSSNTNWCTSQFSTAEQYVSTPSRPNYVFYYQNHPYAQWDGGEQFMNKNDKEIAIYSLPNCRLSYVKDGIIQNLCKYLFPHLPFAFQRRYLRPYCRSGSEAIELFNKLKNSPMGAVYNDKRVTNVETLDNFLNVEDSDIVETLAYLQKKFPKGNKRADLVQNKLFKRLVSIIEKAPLSKIYGLGDLNELYGSKWVKIYSILLERACVDFNFISTLEGSEELSNFDFMYSKLKNKQKFIDSAIKYLKTYGLPRDTNGDDLYDSVTHTLLEYMPLKDYLENFLTKDNIDPSTAYFETADLYDYKRKVFRYLNSIIDGITSISVLLKFIKQFKYLEGQGEEDLTASENKLARDLRRKIKERFKSLVAKSNLDKETIEELYKIILRA